MATRKKLKLVLTLTERTIYIKQSEDINRGVVEVSPLLEENRQASDLTQHIPYASLYLS